MTTTDNPIFQAMLELAGYATEGDLRAAVGDKALEPSQSRMMRHLLGAFNDLKSSENDLITSLFLVQAITTEQLATAEKGGHVDPTWLASSLEKVTKANAKVTELRDRIPELLWIATGKVPGRD